MSSSLLSSTAAMDSDQLSSSKDPEPSPTSIKVHPVPPEIGTVASSPSPIEAPVPPPIGTEASLTSPIEAPVPPPIGTEASLTSPIEAPVPPPGMEAGPVIGIDLGTTYSSVAVWRDGHADIIPDDQGKNRTPCYVAFNKDKRLIGEPAKNQAGVNPVNTVFNAKRLIGLRFSDAIVQSDIKLWPFKVISGPEDNPMIAVKYKGEEKMLAPEEISSMVLTKMKEFAEANLGTPIKNAVIAVPTYFNDSQRQATKHAAIIAGLSFCRIISESTAAAIAYGIHNKPANSLEKNVVIFDLGGGNLEVSLVTISTESVIDVKATSCNAHLGGEDFDNRMISRVVKEFHTQTNKDMSGDPKALRRLRTACEEAKRILSSNSETTIQLDHLYDGVDLNTTFTRADFEDLNRDLARACLEVVEKCLSDAKMEKSSVDDILLVGGSTRIPIVQQLLQDFFGKDLCKSINADEAVAYGAAVLAAMLSDEFDSKVAVTPPVHKRVPNIIVRSAINVDGIDVSAEDEATRQMATPIVEDIEKKIQEAEKYKREDEEQKKKAMARNSLIYCEHKIKDAIEETTNGGKLSPTVVKQIKDAVDQAVEWVESNDLAKVEEIEVNMKEVQNLYSTLVKAEQGILREEVMIERKKATLARNSLGSYVGLIRVAMEDAKNRWELAMKKIENQMELTMQWVDSNEPLVEGEFHKRMEHLQRSYKTLITADDWAVSTD